MQTKRKIRVAILDLYEGQPNQGMRCIHEILSAYGRHKGLILEWTNFDVRLKKQVPDLSYDFYISSGGPGSPLDSEKTEWENAYFLWLKELFHYNHRAQPFPKKHALFICHSFQLAVRYFKVAQVSRRRSTAFGVFPIHVQAAGKKEAVFSGLRDPFYAVDSRDYQVTAPNHAVLNQLGAHVLAIEKERPHVPLERAIMAIRFNPFMLGTQFHPEADATGMSMYLQREDKKHTVIAEHGEAKWKSMIEQLNDPDKIKRTYNHVLPNFMNIALAH